MRKEHYFDDDSIVYSDPYSTFLKSSFESVKAIYSVVRSGPFCGSPEWDGGRWIYNFDYNYIILNDDGDKVVLTDKIVQDMKYGGFYD